MAEKSSMPNAQRKRKSLIFGITKLLLFVTITLIPISTDQRDSNPDLSGAFAICRGDMCTCTKGSIVCTCADSPSGKVRGLHVNAHSFSTTSAVAATIAPSRTHERATVEQFVVHNCPRVTLGTNAFRGLAIVDQLKLVDITTLHVETNAFRSIRKSPRQVTVQNTQLGVVPANAFTGLTHVQHFWWRNVSVERFNRAAFAKLAYMQYVYFREVRIGSLESEAFGNMHQIGYFYLRGSINLGFVGNNLFTSSKIEELFFEDTTVKNGDFSLILAGLSAKRVRAENCRWLGPKIPNKMARNQPRNRRKLGEIHVRNCNFQRLRLGPLENTSSLVVELSEITHLGDIDKRSPHSPHIGYSIRKLPDEIHQTLLPLQRLQLSNSKIDHWQSNAIALGGRSMDFLWIRNCSVGRVHVGAIHAAIIGEFRVDTATTIRRIQAAAFVGAVFGTVRFVGIGIERIGREAFVQSKIEEFLMEETRIDRMDVRAFGRMNVSKMHVENCIFGDMGKFAFEGTSTNSLLIHNTSFRTPLDISIFNGLHIRSFASISNCLLNCQPSACELNALFLRPTLHTNLIWQFEGNQCVNDPAYPKKPLHRMATKRENPPLHFEEYPHSKSGNKLKYQINDQMNDLDLDPQDHTGNHLNVKTLSEDTEVNNVIDTEKNDRQSVNSEYNTQASDYEGSEEGPEKICIRESTWSNGQFHCRRRAIVEECICFMSKPNSVDGETLEVAYIPTSTATILLIGDCSQKVVLDQRRQEREHYRFNSHTNDPSVPAIGYRLPEINNDHIIEYGNGSSTKPLSIQEVHPQYIYLYRLDQVHIQTIGTPVRRLHVLHSRVYFDGENAFERIILDELVIERSAIEALNFAGLEGASINKVVINGTQIMEDQRLALMQHPNIGEVKVEEIMDERTGTDTFWYYQTGTNGQKNLAPESVISIRRCKDRQKIRSGPTPSNRSSQSQLAQKNSDNCSTSPLKRCAPEQKPTFDPDVDCPPAEEGKSNDDQQMNNGQAMSSKSFPASTYQLVQVLLVQVFFLMSSFQSILTIGNRIHSYNHFIFLFI